MFLNRTKNKVIVVGAGAGGLASAVMLQNSGFQVTLLEKNENIGGKLNHEDYKGYVFDTGPSILTLPGVLRELFALTGKDLSDYLELVELDPQWGCFFDDGVKFDLRSGEEAMVEEIRKFAPKDIDGFRQLSKRAHDMYKLSEENFFFRDLGSVVDIIKRGEKKSFESLKLLSAIDPLRSYSGLVKKYISSPHLRQALEHFTQYVGSSPFLSPAILGCLIHVQFEKGVWYPMGGMCKISQALAKRFEELGGTICLNSEVTRISDNGHSITGIETQDGKKWTADEYVVNMDVNTLYEKMGQKAVESKPLACSGVTVFLGLKKRVKGLNHHNFFFSRSHQEEFRDLYEKGVPHQDPTVYVCMPTVTDPSVAPANRENVFLLIHAPTVNEKTNWDQYLDSYVKVVEGKLAKMGFDIEAHGVEFRQARSPKGIGERWGTYRGNIYGIASHGKFSGAFKLPNQSRQFSNLQLAGGTVNPGAGVPMSLMSGMIAGSNLIARASLLHDLRV